MSTYRGGGFDGIDPSHAVVLGNQALFGHRLVRQSDAATFRAVHLCMIDADTPQPSPRPGPRLRRFAIARLSGLCARAKGGGLSLAGCRPVVDKLERFNTSAFAARSVCHHTAGMQRR